MHVLATELKEQNIVKFGIPLIT